jgi:SpoVK/Ycf46/Vps4 family AAA+-type ATPase
VVDFPRPDAAARLKILRGMFPEDIKRPNDEELKVIAETFTLSGGNIKNVVIDAAFRAFAEAGPEGPEITVRHLVLGVARELQKLGMTLTKGDFGAEYYAWISEEILSERAAE